MLRNLLVSIVTITALISSAVAKEKPELLFYCGITMVHPMSEIARNIEKKENCKIKILQGGSQNLYNSLKSSKLGDIYLPGSNSYIKKNKKDGFFERSVYVGYNKAAIFVQKGNPKHIKNLDSLLDEDIATVLCNPKSGSIGKNTKKVLLKYKGQEFFDDAYDMAIEIGTDSRDLNKALKDKKVDMAVNWRTSAFWLENRPYIEVVEIDSKYAPKKKLMLTSLKFSKHKDIVKKFLDYASGKEGQAIMKKYGFTD